MANSHVAHDCQVGDCCILANSAGLAGHVTLEDHVILGGLGGVHQFARIGRFAFSAAGSIIVQDVAPYCMVQGDRAEVAGINAVGLARNGYSEEQVGRVKEAYKILFRQKLALKEACQQLRDRYAGQPEIDHLLSFLEGVGERGLVR
jgi:UDP-N-acetylglucosamine acyltransferase